MGIAIPQVITPSKATGAQVIDGSLKFDGAQYLTRTPGSAGNRRTWTWSCWVKRTGGLGTDTAIAAVVDSGSNGFYFRFRNDDALEVADYSGSFDYRFYAAEAFRDLGWYHIHILFDSTQSTESDRVKIYKNGSQITSWDTATYPSQNYDSDVNNAKAHEIGRSPGAVEYAKISLSNVYVIDGQALGPENFGFTDGLTNTWKPKKYTGTFGTNGFYLPMDGNSQIGRDESGNGNDFTPVNFGGSKSPDKATGAKPILNTLPGGAHATVGVFGSRENVGYAVTVYNDGGGNKYYIDGVKQDTVTGLIRGATYTFDTSDSTVSSHPFRFSATSNGSHGGGSEYTNGVAAITGAATTITVPHDAPNTLYYYCTSHSGMGADITGITTNEKLADQYASHVTLALPLVGSSVDVCASIACTSTAKAITSNGTVAASSIESNFYSGSFLFDGDSDYFTFAPGGDFAFGTADFTIECWCYSKNRGTYDYIIDGRNSGQTTGTWTLAYGYSGSGSSLSGNLEFASGGSTLLECPTANNPEAGRWFHVAVARSGTSLKMFIDGVEVTSATNSTDFSTSPSTSYIGTRYSQQHYWDGYMQDIRVYKGVAKYTSDFTPASTNPDILPDSPSGVSGGSKRAKIQSTGGSVAFSGGTNGSDIKWTGTVAATHTLDYYVFASGNQSAGAGPVFLSDGTDGYQFDFSTGTDDLIRAEKAGGGSDTGYQRLNKGWNHIRLVQQTTSAAMYINGKAAGTFSPAGGVIGSTTFYIGTKARLASSVWFRGFICNVRIIEAALTGTDTPVINDNGVIASSEGGTSAIFLWPGVNSLTENTGTDGNTITATADPVLTKFNPFTFTDINIVRGQDTGENYCTINPLDNPGESPYGNQGAVISNGNLDIAADGGSYAMRKGTIAVPSSGKWYYEATVNGSAASRSSSSQASGIGLIKSNVITDGDAPITDNHTLWLGDSGYGKPFGSGTRVEWVNQTIDQGDVISLALDMDANTFEFKVDGVSVQSGDINTTEPVHPFVFSSGTSNTNLTLNFGQKPFKFPPPEGYLPLNNVNTRPAKVISRPDQYVGISTWTGDGNTGRNIRTLQFKPDLVWIKQRSATRAHALFDSVRGANKRLQSSSTNAETTHTDQMSAFIDNGFTVEDNNTVNVDSGTYVGWSWRAGGNKNTFNVDDVGYASASDVNMSVGSLNSVAYDTSQTWSNNLAVNTGSISAITQAFNGNLTNGADSTGSTGSNDRTMTATLGLTLNNEIVEVFPNHTYSGYYATIDGVAQPIQYFTTTNGFQTMGPFTGTLTSVTVTNGTESSQRPAGIRAIRVGGKILVDNGITPPDLPTIAATGASVGTKQGFSIIKYDGNGTAGSSIPHGLSQIPEFVIVKDTEDTDNWQIYHADAQTSGAKLLKFTNAAASDNTGPWNNSAPTSTLISLGGGGTNDSSNTHICYAWHSVPGLQKFGIYMGNDSSDGPYVELGFRPSLIWIKGVDFAANWFIFDNKRNGVNPTDQYLLADTTGATGGTAVPIDFLSNGFKVRFGTAGFINNTSSYNFIYCAWAEAPTVDLFGGGANAR